MGNGQRQRLGRFKRHLVSRPPVKNYHPALEDGAQQHSSELGVVQMSTDNFHIKRRSIQTLKKKKKKWD